MKSKEQNWYFYSDIESSQSWYAVYLNQVPNLTVKLTLAATGRYPCSPKWSSAVFKVRSEIRDFSKAMGRGDRTHVQVPISASTPISDHNIVSSAPHAWRSTHAQNCISPIHCREELQELPGPALPQHWGTAATWMQGERQRVPVRA